MLITIYLYYDCMQRLYDAPYGSYHSLSTMPSGCYLPFNSTASLPTCAGGWIAAEKASSIVGRSSGSAAQHV